MRHIPYGRQWISEDDIEAVAAVLRSGWLTQGPKINEFEEALAEYFGSRYAVTCSSGTAGLHLACLAANLTPEDIVFTSPMTFVASANCALYVGARPDFIDIQPDSANMDPRKLAERLEELSALQRPLEVDGQQLAAGLPAAVIPVHFAGHPADMVAISKVAQDYELTVIEDACHAWGAKYRDDDGAWNKVGACQHSDMTVFSSHPLKHITTGEGGVITTNDSEIYGRLLMFRSHGITKDPGKIESGSGPWYYEMQALGYNYRMTDFQCALGLSQLRRLDSFVERRREIADVYNRNFANLPNIQTPVERDDIVHAHHLYVLRLATTAFMDREQLFNSLRADGLGVNVHYIPVHLQPYYRGAYGYALGDFPVAEDIYARSISLPLFPAMTDTDVRQVIESVRQHCVS